jgi:hypothetical protein
MHGGAMTYKVVSLGSSPHRGGPLPTAQEINDLFRRAIARKKRQATFWAMGLDDPTPQQYKFIVRISTADFDHGRYELFDQDNRWFPLDAADHMKAPIQFEVITT